MFIVLPFPWAINCNVMMDLMHLDWSRFGVQLLHRGDLLPCDIYHNNLLVPLLSRGTLPVLLRVNNKL